MGWLEQQREKQKREAQSRKLASKFARGLDTPSGNPLFDSAYWDEVGSGVMDAINRGGVAGLVGASVDIVNTVMRPIGLGSDKPVMGSEWIGDRMQQAGIVSGTRNPIAETLAGFVDPATIAPFAMKAAAVAIPALAALGATAIGSKASQGAKLSSIAMAGKAQRGSLSPGIYPSHAWNLKGNELRNAIKEMSDIVPTGSPDPHQKGVADLVYAIKERGLLPKVDVDKGGSVYVSAFQPRKNLSGSMNMKSAPVPFGREFASNYGTSKEPYLVRFSDHGQYYNGPVMSIDPLSGNKLDTALQYLDYAQGKAARPQIGRSSIIPALGEQTGDAIDGVVYTK